MDDVDVEAFARAHRRKRRVRLSLLAAVIASPFLFLGWKCYSTSVAVEERREARRKELELTEEERAMLRTTIARGRQVLAAAREGWMRAVTPEALAAVSPGTGACDIRLVAPTMQAAASYVRHRSIDGNYFGNVFFHRHPAGEPIRPIDIDADLERLDKFAAELEANTMDRNDASLLRSIDERALFVVVEQETEPMLTVGLTGAGGFMPGRLVGTAYVYSYRQQRIICVGALDVQSSESIEFDFSYMAENVLDRELKERQAAEGTLHRDLEVRVQQAIARNLRAAAPAGAGAPDVAPDAEP